MQYAAILHPASGLWMLGAIDDHEARPLTSDEIEAVIQSLRYVRSILDEGKAEPDKVCPSDPRKESTRYRLRLRMRDLGVTDYLIDDSGVADLEAVAYHTSGVVWVRAIGGARIAINVANLCSLQMWNPDAPAEAGPEGG